ncbi:DUF1801 domain-containing protein [Anaeromicropila herbilytica]|uniref:DUF1801 domain-containing protein n=1 Tax=Anaeromicropila herbilytica TaxID=2785025 RepID=A0A7R7EHS6_9FIRM|nr:DUF1801 domain-containing protein [Anaeromicropila herbilytica]BCN29096.1 hypothetical protein bsdtb5_03910 [Anaeromicropila herbilytica]
MTEEIQSYIDQYGEEIQLYFNNLRELIYKSTTSEIEEKLWAKLPSYYVGEKFVRIIPFKDHVNIEASAIMEHRNQLEQFKITPKGMLQIYANQDIPCKILEIIFRETYEVNQ